MLSNQVKNQHLLWRAGFGPTSLDSPQLNDISQTALWQSMVKTSAEQPVKITVFENGLLNENNTAQNPNLNRQQLREGLRNLNIAWLNEMINSKSQLREKMSLFWHGHFACRVFNGYLQQQLLHTIRTHALGNFKVLLLEVSKSAAMLRFLNNQQNRKGKPNENFARELMELFTLGRGNYTEKDVKEAARAFTGWGFNAKGEFVFRKFLHDDGEKTFLGKTGNFSGDDIINILLEQKQTAQFLTEKIFRFYVNEAPNKNITGRLAHTFYESGYNITALLNEIFSSNWFYEEKNVGNRIKSPVELIAGIRRFLPVSLEKEETQIIVQRVLGQVLFLPPNVAGWPGGKNWIDSSSLMFRLRIAQAFANNDMPQVRGKEDDDVEMGTMRSLNNRFGKIDINWEPVYTRFQKVNREKLAASLKESVLQNNSLPLEKMEAFTDKSSRENYIRSMIIQLMSTPDYQLC